jgi:hypothetical protein
MTVGPLFPRLDRILGVPGVMSRNRFVSGWYINHAHGGRWSIEILCTIAGNHPARLGRDEVHDEPGDDNAQHVSPTSAVNSSSDGTGLGLHRARQVFLLQRGVKLLHIEGRHIEEVPVLTARAETHPLTCSPDRPIRPVQRRTDMTQQPAEQKFHHHSSFTVAFPLRCSILVRIGWSSLAHDSVHEMHEVTRLKGLL